MLEAHYSGEINIKNYWHVGDTRLIHLNEIASPNTNGYTEPCDAQNITVVITALNHHDLKEKIGIRDKAAITVQTREVLNNITDYAGSDTEGTVFINFKNDTETIFTKWSELPLRIWMNNQFLNTCFSSELQNLIKETKHNRLITNGETSKETEEVIDKIFLPSYPEILGNTRDTSYLNGATPNGEEGTQWDYYKISSNKIRYGNDNGNSNSNECCWWIGSSSSYIDNYNNLSFYTWFFISSINSGCFANIGNTAISLAPAFCL